MAVGRANDSITDRVYKDNSYRTEAANTDREVTKDYWNLNNHQSKTSQLRDEIRMLKVQLNNINRS